MIKTFTWLKIHERRQINQCVGAGLCMCLCLWYCCFRAIAQIILHNLINFYYTVGMLLWRYHNFAINKNLNKKKITSTSLPLSVCQRLLFAQNLKKSFKFVVCAVKLNDWILSIHHTPCAQSKRQTGFSRLACGWQIIKMNIYFFDALQSKLMANNLCTKEITILIDIHLILWLQPKINSCNCRWIWAILFF